jgi:CRISPR-associated protein Csd1
MSALASLFRAYQRLPDAPAFGFSMEKIGFLVSLNADGSPAGLPIDLREGEGKRKTACAMLVPQPPKRTSGVAANFLWDKTAYALGVTAGEGKRTSREHEAFVETHRRVLGDSSDEGLRALLRFLESWSPTDFASRGWPAEMKDENVAFALESERLRNIRIHDRPAARALWARLCAETDKSEAACLITGEHGPIARLHPAIKGRSAPKAAPRSARARERKSVRPAGGPV